MASRQEEKERRKRERQEQEQAAASAAQRKRLLSVIAGVAVAAVVVVGVALAVGTRGGSGGGSGGDGPRTNPDTANVALPPQRTDDFAKAVKAAGCTFKEFSSEGSEHSGSAFTGYKTNPPTSGTHNPTPAEDGTYDPANAPEANNWVHTLEHGRVIFLYAPGTPQRRIDQLEALFNRPVQGGPGGYHTLLLQSKSKMPFEVAAVSWTRSVGCRQLTDRSFDALRLYRDKFVDKGPETVT